MIEGKTYLKYFDSTVAQKHCRHFESVSDYALKCYAFVRGHELVNIIAYVKELSLFENTHPVSSFGK